MSLRKGPFDFAQCRRGLVRCRYRFARSDGAWGGTETVAESTGKMCVIAKAAGIGDLAERLTCLHQRAAFDQTRSTIQSARGNVVTACRPADREQLLQIAQGNSRLGSHLARRDVRIGRAVLDDAADAPEQLITVARAKRGGRCKQCAEEIVDHQAHIVVSRRDRRFYTTDGVKNELTEYACRLPLPPPARATLRLKAEMRQQVLARQLQAKPLRFLDPN